jgi:hypothetical protein
VSTTYLNSHAFGLSIRRQAKAERYVLLAPREDTKPNELLSDVAGTGWNTRSAMILSSISLLSEWQSKIKPGPEVSTSNADMAEVTPVIEETEILPLGTIQVKLEGM